jgi:hypothetical protein
MIRKEEELKTAHGIKLIEADMEKQKKTLLITRIQAAQSSMKAKPGSQ